MAKTVAPAPTLTAGFSDPVHDAQRAFRQIITAISRPGKIVELHLDTPPPPGLDVAAAAICLTLLDVETRIFLDPSHPSLTRWLGFHTGCPIVKTPDTADFSILKAGSGPVVWDGFRAGSDERPDQSMTLLLQVTDFHKGTRLRLSGPGIRDSVTIAVAGPGAGFFSEREKACVFPRGIDCMFTCGNELFCLPRTTKLEVC